MTRSALVSAVLVGIAACGADHSSDRSRETPSTSAAAPDHIAAEGADPEAALDSTCEFVKSQAHSDPDSLIAEFAARAARGDFDQTNSWLGSAVDCYGHEPGYDSFDVASSYSTERVSSVPDTIRYLLAKSLVGIVVGGEFERSESTLHDTLTVYRTKYGWRIQSPAPWNWIDYDHAKAKGWVKAE